MKSVAATRVLCAVTAFAVVSGLLVSQQTWSSGAATAQEAPADAIEAAPPASDQTAPEAAPAAGDTSTVSLPTSVPMAPEAPAATTPGPTVSCGSIALGGIVQIAAQSNLFICAADGRLHWVGDTRALQQQAQQGTFMDWTNEVSLDAATIDALPRGDPWLSAGFIKSGDPIGVVKWELDAAPVVLGLRCLADVELVGLTTANYGLVHDTDSWARTFNQAAPAPPWPDLPSLTGCGGSVVPSVFVPGPAVVFTGGGGLSTGGGGGGGGDRPPPAPAAPTANPSATPIPTETPVPADTSTPTSTVTPTPTPTSTSTPTSTATPTSTPIALPITSNDGPFQVLGNVKISVGAPGVLGNDTRNGASISALQGTTGSSPFSGTSAHGGNVTLRADGSYDFNPKPGYVGPDSFTYTLTNATGSSTATVSETVAGMIWFVDNALTTNGDGRLSSPFNCLVGPGCFSTGTTSVGGAGDSIFLYRQTAATYSGGLTLLDSQLLIGQGATVSLSSLTNLVAPPGSLPLPGTGGTNPIIVTTAAGANALNLGVGNTIDGLTIGNKTGAGIFGVGFGTLVVNDVSIIGTGGALQLTTGTVNGTLANVSSSSGSFNVLLADITGNLDMAHGALSGADVFGLLVIAGSGSISYGGTIASLPSVAAVAVAARTGGSVVVSGDISRGPLTVQGNTGGTVVFSGSSKSVSTLGNVRAVDLFENSGSSASFTNGGLHVTTDSGDAFATTNSGTVSVTGAGNTLQSATGLALVVDRTVIGSAGLTFQSITAGTGSTGPEFGIVLNSTGSSGGLTVTGTGLPASGGTIQNTSNSGVLLTDTTNVSLTSMAIEATGGSGINGQLVVNFSFINGSINASYGGSNIGFQTTLLGTENNVAGTLTVTGNTLNNAAADGVLVHNFAGTLSKVNISNNTLISATSLSISGGSGIELIADGSASTVANVTQATITNNTVRNFPNGSGIRATGGNASATGPGGIFGFPNDSARVITIAGNHIDGTSALVEMGGFGIDTSVRGSNSGSRSQANFSVINNGTGSSPLSNIANTAIQSFAFDFATSTAAISGNVVAPNNRSNAYGINAATSSLLNNPSTTPDLTATVSANIVSQTDLMGIFIEAFSVSGTLKAKVLSNVVAAPTRAGGGIALDTGNASPTLCVGISGNTSAGSSGAAGISVNRYPAPNVFGISGINLATPTNAEVVSYLNAQNPAGNGTAPGGTPGFTQCSLP